MKQWQTLRFRFALWTAGLLLVALVLFSLFIYASMSRRLTAAVDENLDAIAMQLMIERGRDGLLPIEDIAEEPQYEYLREQGFSVRVQDLTGESVQLYGPYYPLLQPIVDFGEPGESGYFATLIDPSTQVQIRVYATQISSRGQMVGFLQIAQNLTTVSRTLNSLLVTLLIGGPLMTILAGVSGYFLAARALRPIDEMTRTARQISAQDLSARLHLPSANDEVGRLATTFNSMLARLDDAFRRERQFTSDASHELRTPLAAMQVIISSTIARQRNPAEYEQALVDLNEEVEQMRRLAEGLLHLARNDAVGQPAKFEPVDLAILLRDVIDSLAPLAEDKGLCLVDQIATAKLILLGDSDSLIRLFVNLLDNAIKYTAQGSITITAQAQEEQRLAVTICDTGIGIDPAHLPHIFDRFYRVDTSRSTEGAGLGLAIARDIARAHGGDILIESEGDQGTNVTVTLATS